MYIEIVDLIRKCDRRKVAFAVGTLLCGIAMVSPLGTRSAQAADEAAITKLIETNECQGCDLHGADLRRLDLSGADLTEADLEGANFYYANLDGAQLNDANLIDVNFGYTSARGALLNGADLRYAILDNTDFTGASLIEADLRESYLNDTVLTGTILNSADMRDTLFFSVDFSQASLCSVRTWAGTEYRRGCNVAVPEEIEYRDK
ncbi:MAG: pentapeptide repeat-containing protein [Phormidesmis sp.]